MTVDTLNGEKQRQDIISQGRNLLQRNLLLGYPSLLEKTPIEYEAEFILALQQGELFSLAEGELVSFPEARLDVLVQARSLSLEVDPAIFNVPDVWYSPPYAVKLKVLPMERIYPEDALVEIPVGFRTATAAEAFGLDPRTLFLQQVYTVLLAGDYPRGSQRVLALEKIGERVKLTHQHVSDYVDFAGILLARK